MIEGRKTFEVRREHDRTFAVRDQILLREFVPPLGGGYTGRAALVIVTYILRSVEGVPPGVAILAIHLQGWGDERRYRDETGGEEKED